MANVLNGCHQKNLNASLIPYIKLRLYICLMRLKYTLLFLLLLNTGLLIAQKVQPGRNALSSTVQKKNIYNSSSKNAKLTGIWRGHFISTQHNNFGMREVESYKYEVQINQLPNNALKGVTYSYKTTVFYGKTSLQGIFMKGTKNVLIKELEMLELRIVGPAEPCMMTCNLEYAKTGNKETLTGTFSSVNTKNNRDCGEGTVYLEKVPESDFVKEDFLIKKAPTPLAKTGKPQPKPSPYNPPSPKKPASPYTKPFANPNTEAKKPTFKPGAEDALVKKDAKEKLNSTPQKIEEPKVTTVAPSEKKKEIEPAKPLAKELTERTNNLVKTMYVDEGEIEISLYDNGEIDNDTVTVYHNNEMVIAHGRLSASPLTVRIKVDAAHPTHEFIMVADNLGEIPPNTSLMTINAGKKQYSVFLTSDDSRNAKVIIQYRPKTEDTKNK